MKTKQFFLLVMCFAVFTIVMVSPSRASGIIITFDDLSERAEGNFITNGYQGFTWVNFGAGNALLNTNTYGLSGVFYGMVSASNVVVNAGGNPAEIDSPSTHFNFLSTYLTGAWNSNLNIEVKGFSGDSLLYDTNVAASATAPTLFTFNYLNIDRLTFNSFGGEPAGFPSGSGAHFVMDNFSYEPVPEPSTVLLAALGALTLCALLKRKPG